MSRKLSELLAMPFDSSIVHNESKILFNKIDECKSLLTEKRNTLEVSIPLNII